MKKLLTLFLFFGVSFSSCVKQETADSVFHNGSIFSFNEENTIYEAMALKNGKIVELGPEHYIMNKYLAEDYYDLKKKIVIPQLVEIPIQLQGKKDTLSNMAFLSYDSIANINVSNFNDSILGIYLTSRFQIDSTSIWSENFYQLLNELYQNDKVLSIEASLINNHPKIFELIKQTLKGYNDKRWNIRNAHLLGDMVIQEMVKFNLIPIVPDSIYNSLRFSEKISLIKSINGIICISDFPKNELSLYGNEENLKIKTRINAIALKKENTIGKLEKDFNANFCIYDTSPFQNSDFKLGKISCFQNGKPQI